MPETRIRILHLEDVPADAELAERELVKAGIAYEIQRVETREAFLSALSDRAPDLILSDYRLPKFDGMQALLLAKEHAPNVPVIITTGSVNEETAVTCMKAGAADYVLKESLGRLGTAVQAALERKKLSEDRRRADEALRVNEARLRSLFNGMLGGYAHCRVLFEKSVAVDWIYLDVNPAFGRLTGLEDVVGKRVTEVIPGIRAENPKLFETYGHVASTGESRVFEDRVPGLNHSYAVSAYSPRKGEFVAVFDDITERKQAEERLAKSELYFRSIIENSLDLTVVLSLEARFLFVSPAMERLLGYRPADLQGSIAFDLIHSEDRRAVESAFRRVLENGARVEKADFRFRHRDGSWRTLSTLAQLLAPETGIPGVIVNGLDVSERIHLEAQLVQAQKMEAVGRLAGGVAHDFNNLLTVIQGYAEMLTASLAGDSQEHESASEIVKAAERAAALTRQLLAFSRKQVLEVSILDIGMVVADTEKLLKRLIGEDVEVVVVKPASLGRVKADPGQIEQVVLNLAVNARDAMPGGGRLTLELADTDLDAPLAAGPDEIPPGRYVVLSIADTGSGIDAETLGHIFEPFFTTKEKGKGTGLGLATVYGIVRQTGGYVAVESSPGAGSTFRVYLPRCAETMTSGIRPSVSSRPGTETVLLVEDEPPVRALAKAILERRGYIVLVAESGAAALDVVSRDPRPIHLMLTDLVMPGMNGRELASLVVAQRPAMKVVFMSGYAADVVKSVDESDAFSFLPKPFTERALTGKIREVLDAPPP